MSPESSWIIMISLLWGKISYEKGFQGYYITPLELSSSSFPSTSQSQGDRNGTQIRRLSTETVYEHRLSLLHREYSWSQLFSLRIYRWLYYVSASVLHHSFWRGERISHSDLSKDNTAFIDSMADKILALKTKYLVHWLVGQIFWK